MKNAYDEIYEILGNPIFVDENGKEFIIIHIVNEDNYDGVMACHITLDHGYDCEYGTYTEFCFGEPVYYDGKYVNKQDYTTFMKDLFEKNKHELFL